MPAKQRSLPASNHGAVYREIAEYNEPGQRIVICELRDGWHVVEVYLTSGDTTQRVIREVVETLAEARAWARGRLGVVADELQQRIDASEGLMGVVVW